MKLMKITDLKYDKIVPAKSTRVDKLTSVARDFFPKILNMDYDEVWITDESSIYDFDFELTGNKIKHKTKSILNKIKKVYGLDVSDLKRLYLKDIFKRIEKHELSGKAGNSHTGSKGCHKSDRISETESKGRRTNKRSDGGSISKRS